MTETKHAAPEAAFNPDEARDDTEEFDTTDLYLFAAAIVGAARAALKRIEGHG